MRTKDAITEMLASPEFLSIQAQDFIEDGEMGTMTDKTKEFLSIQAQDFIEERRSRPRHLK